MKVKELIELLKKCPKNKEVGIDDADTDWVLKILYVKNNKRFVHIGSDYYTEEILSPDKEE